jgi:hypothetical protein
MAYINPVQIDLNISLAVLKGRKDAPYLDTLCKVAVYSIIPIAIIVFLEAIIKKLAFTLCNVAITIINLSQPKAAT